MPKIHVLSQHIANQIAAGEVVERPASVVKELVENSIDAGARHITIDITDGGIGQIVVADDGSGIEEEDCKTAFLRHATSKLSTASQLDSIQTLGFRGEALASIASVTEVELTTRTAHNKVGTRLKINNGVFSDTEQIACNKGTVFKVNNLFLNTPARLKFLKSARTEAGYVSDFVARAILANSDVAISYSSNGRLIYSSSGSGRLDEAILCVYGVDVANSLIPISFDNGYIQIEGFIGTSEITKPNRSYQSFFVNDRYIKSSALSFAMSRAYDTRLTHGRFPFGILKIRLAYQEVDVNVHPAKTEIRFIDEWRVSSSVFVACQQALQQGQTVDANIGADRVGACASTDFDNIGTAFDSDHGVGDRSRALGSRIEYPSDSPAEASYSKKELNITQPSEPRGYANTDNRLASNTAFERITLHSPTPNHEVSQRYYSILDGCRSQNNLFNSNNFSVIGCAFNAYWLVQWNDGIYFIDQHAAHERLLYERLCNNTVPFGSQKLLFAKELTMLQSDLELLEQHEAIISGMGFEWDVLEGTKISLKAIPQLNGKILDENYLYDCVEIAASGESTLSVYREKMMQSACKHAVKAGDRLSELEINHLMTVIGKEGIPLTCPHGRPIVFKMDKSEIEKRFLRIQ